MRCCGVIVAGGVGSRMGAGINKAFIPVNKMPVIAHTLKVFEVCKEIDAIIIVTRECDLDICNEIVKKYNISKIENIVIGGATRQKSVYNGLVAVNNDYDIVAIHDAARALVSQDEIKNCVSDAFLFGAAAVGVKSKDTLKVVDEQGFILSTLDREYVYNIQTPQVFKRELIIKAHEFALENNFEGTDDCSVVEFYGERIKITQGSYDNIKLTTPEDIAVAENIINSR